MSDLQNLTPANTYKALLQIGDYTDGISGDTGGNALQVTDGAGNNTALAISTNRVGIGTTSPSQELDVNGDIASSTLTTSGAVTAGSVSTSGAVGAGSIDVSGNVVADEYALDQAGSSSSAVAIHAPTTNELAIRTNSSEQVRIDSSGQVGIGVTDPSAKTVIKSGVNSLPDSDISADTGTALRILGADAAAIDLGSTGRVNNGGVGQWIQARHSEVDSTYYDLLLNPIGGNVGIGTDTPSAPLEVSSTTGGVIMPRMTSTERNDIAGSGTDGEVIYNTTLNKFQGRANGSWVDLH